MEVAVRGLVYATQGEWAEAFGDVAPTSDEVQQDLEQFSVPHDSNDVNSVARKWGCLDSAANKSGKVVGAGSLAWSITNTVCNLRLARAWEDLDLSYRDANAFKAAFHRAAFLKEKSLALDTSEEEFEHWCNNDATLGHDYKAFVNKRRKEVTSRNRLWRCYQALGFIVILDPRWAVDAMTHGGYEKAALSVHQDLAKRAPRLHPLATLQGNIVQALLSLAVKTGSAWLVEAVDDFVHATRDALKFQPVLSVISEDPDAESGGSSQPQRQQLYGTFTTDASDQHDWRIRVPGVEATSADSTRGSSIRSNKRRRVDDD
ncbi:hypothetical protein EXIGLDRAFT_716282 [Exidia glandulosa HHB12029]|uniref:Uncharacterized protein n=1 Tax=Exidia glandulosa HHB12029 TaxID=1314781 RepID=A0A165R0A7_EXIGL|nr:hypothetical protein EXIGLDRAFT_716282 [Exidia glandulosa HHB12029]